MSANGAAPDDWSDWVAERRLAATLGISVKQLQALGKDLAITAKQSPDRCLRYSKEDAEALRLAHENASDRAGSENAAAAALRVATQHAERVFGMALPAFDKALARQNETIVALTEQNQRLQAQLDEQRKIRDEIESERFARETVAKQTEKSDARKERLFRVLADRLPKLWAQIEASALGKSLIATITPEQAATLLAFQGFLSAEQKTLLTSLLPESTTPEEHAADAAPTEETPNE